LDYYTAIEISAAGMTAERTRIEAATLNLANMNVSAPPGAAGYRPVTAVIRPGRAVFPALMGIDGGATPGPQAHIVPQVGTGARLSYEPGHPDADANGMVAYPNIDHTGEMMTVVTAMRAYEANLAALQVSRTLVSKALEIGGQ
jgi:flagellar basal-body rod protein FlgC